MAKALMMASLGGVTAAGTQYSAGALLERPTSARPCGRSHLGFRARVALNCGMGRTTTSTSTRSRSVLLAALPRSNDEDELDEEDDEIGVSEAERRQTLQKQKLEQLEKMQKQRPQDALKELMRQKMQQQPEQQGGGVPQGSDEERVLQTLEKLEQMFENEEPSEGLKQLLAMVESAPAIEEPPPAPKWLQTVGPIGVIVALSFVVSYLNNVLEEYYAKKRLEKLEKQARENKPRKPVKPSWVSTMMQRLEVSVRSSTMMQRLEISLREFLDRLSRFISRFISRFT